MNKAKLVSINDLKALIVYDPKFVSTTVGIMIKIGSANDFKGKNGVANLLFEILKLQSEKKINSDIVRGGVKIKSIVNKEYTYFCFEDYNNDIESLVKHVFEVIKLPSLSNSILEEAKEKIHRTIDSYHDNVDDAIDNFANENIFSRQVIGKPTLGKHKTIKIITKEEIHDFYKKHYSINNMILVISSPIEIKNVIDRIEPIIKADPSSENTGMFTAFKRYTYHKKFKYLYRNMRNSFISAIFPIKGFKDYHGKIQAEIACKLIEKSLQLDKIDCECSVQMYNSIGIISFKTRVYYSEMQDFITAVQNKIRNLEIDNSIFEATSKSIVQEKTNKVNSSSETAYNFIYHYLHLRKVKKHNFDTEIIIASNKASILQFINENIKIDKMSVFCVGPKPSKEALSTIIAKA